MLMSVTSTSFTSVTAGGTGGVFYLNTIKDLTLTSVTTTDIYAANGRFVYYNGVSGSVPITVTITGSSTYSCRSNSQSAATIIGKTSGNNPD